MKSKLSESIEKGLIYLFVIFNILMGSIALMICISVELIARGLRKLVNHFLENAAYTLSISDKEGTDK